MRTCLAMLIFSLSLLFPPCPLWCRFTLIFPAIILKSLIRFNSPVKIMWNTMPLVFQFHQSYSAFMYWIHRHLFGYICNPLRQIHLNETLILMKMLMRFQQLITLFFPLFHLLSVTLIRSPLNGDLSGCSTP